MPDRHRPTTEAELIALCVALGAASVGGPLSDDEAALVSSAAAAPNEAVAAATAAIMPGGDYLGDAFCAIRSPVVRRDLGAFYTPDLVVRSMLAWAGSAGPVRFVDAGCGSGRYALTAAAEFPAAEVVAVDLDPVATLMTRATAAVRKISLDVRNDSFLTVDLPAVDGATAWVGNPPYLRHHNLPASAKVWAKETAAALGFSVSGLSGLHALFFLAVARHSRPGDVGTFITSSEWMDARYGSIVRELLCGPLGLARIDSVAPEAAVFDDATTTAAVTSFRVGSDLPPTIPFREILDPAELVRLDGGAEVPVARLRALNRWTAVTAPPPEKTSGQTSLGQIATVRRGTATGANKFFCMTPARAEELGLARYAHPVVSRAQEVLSADGVLRAANVAKVVVDLPSDLDGHPEAAAYVAQGERDGVHEGHICSHRRPWWRLNLPSAPDAFATYMARQPIMFAVNPDGVVNLNTVHGLRVVDESTDIEGLVAWLNENRETLVGGRIYQGGLVKVEPKDVEGFMVPATAAGI